MKKAALLLMLTTILLFVCNCESPEIESDNEDQQEEVDKPGKGKDNKDSDGTDNGGGDNKNDSTSTDNDSTYSDTDDGDPNFDYGDGEEHNFVDGNDTTKEKSSDTLSCMEFINSNPTNGRYVKGYIVGTCTKNITNADFVPPFNNLPALLIADSKDTRDYSKIVCIKLNSTSRKNFNLKDHPNYLHRQIYVFGYYAKYLGATGIVDISDMGFCE